MYTALFIYFQKLILKICSVQLYVVPVKHEAQLKFTLCLPCFFWALNTKTCFCSKEINQSVSNKPCNFVTFGAVENQNHSVRVNIARD